MNELNHIPLEEMLLMSFKASDEGNIELAEELYRTFEDTKDKALKLAEKAVQTGDTKTVDTIIASFEKAKIVSKERVEQNNLNKDVENETNKFNQGNKEISFSDQLQNISDDNDLEEKEKIDALAKNILYWVLSGITIDWNNAESIKFSSNIDCTFALIVPSSTSPILAVPATVRNPSGPKNIKSPANSWIVSPFIHPISLVTAVIAKLLVDVPDNLNILFSQNINNGYRRHKYPF